MHGTGRVWRAEGTITHGWPLSRADGHPCEPHLPVEPPPAPGARHLTIQQLTRTTCKFPLGDPQEPGFRFCGAAVDRPPYCRHHRAIAYVDG